MPLSKTNASSFGLASRQGVSVAKAGVNLAS